MYNIVYNDSKVRAGISAESFGGVKKTLDASNYQYTLIADAE